MTKGLLAILASVLLIAGFGCQNDSTPPSSALPEQGIDLNSPTGGLSTSNEAPAFGEPGKFAVLSNEKCVDDPYGDDMDCDDSLRARGAKLYEFRAIWGRLAEMRDSTLANPCPLDWSGTLHMDGGVIVIEKTIAFEADDSISRVDSSTISWVSNTGPGVDGIHVKLVVPSDSSFCGGCTPMLELSTGPYSRTFTLDELFALNMVSPVDTCGNAMSITSVLEPLGCPHGQLMGAWELLPSDSLTPADSLETGGTVLGVLRGVWFARGGLIRGHVKGVFGLNSAGESVFFGKYIDLTGRFMGIVRGTYASKTPPVALDGGNGRGGDKHRELKRDRGRFAGEWIDASVNVQGRLKGRWISSETGKGYFHGIWGMRCDDGCDVDNGVDIDDDKDCGDDD